VAKYERKKKYTLTYESAMRASVCVCVHVCVCVCVAGIDILQAHNVRLINSCHAASDDDEDEN